MVKWKIIKGGITAPEGFEANGISCGIKKGGKLDLALIYSQIPALTAGLFTASRFPANHIILDRKRINKYKEAQAIIINSGNANCAVGKKGLEDAQRITAKLAEELNIKSQFVLIASTGIIGKRLPRKKIERAIPLLVANRGKDKAELASQAIMTTDKKPKEIAVELNISKKKIKIGAMAKGSGMIAPHLATMLCFITTDLNIKLSLLKRALREAVGVSFNRISVDGEMSTNDTLIIMANGLAGNKRIENQRSKEFFIFQEALKFVCQHLSREIVYDGEGATKFITLRIKGAENKYGAERIARRIASSPLFKSAIYGENPNWGRVIASCGASGVNFNPEKLAIRFAEKFVFKNGKPMENASRQLKKILENRDVEIEIDLNLGKEEYFLWTTDLSEEYIRINAGYE
ncbi:MAG: bifunctional glutamate N-acetyltransferase/amino-acid acetyltransferase ArgJ [Candidatus Omnitrophica bacterium]|nr:bifunctional glutamate N-acetyltransferase/amino-acid acetyltransferase ArgJ [Candidatus Omnitrophota bacterium]MCM8793930.1 bifunctional glutamate N-acetyltransferase/amino-acid acetyltransferase ArgJ [Candidatus Omnitrophota bacterium]